MGAYLTRAAATPVQISTLQQQLADARAENATLLSKLYDWGVASKDSEMAGSASRDADGTEYASVASGAAAGVTVAAGIASAATDPGSSQQQQQQQERMQQLEQRLKEAEEAAAAANAALAAAKQQAARDREKVRADQTLLAREIKKLRSELAAATQVGASCIRAYGMRNSAHAVCRERHEVLMQLCPCPSERLCGSPNIALWCSTPS